MNLIDDPVTRAILEQAAQNVFDTFKRAFQLYITPQKAYLSTDPNYSPFNEVDQNTFNPPVAPQVFTFSGTMLYQNKMENDYIEPGNRSNYQQSKLRNAAGLLRLKVDASGYAAMQGCKQLVVDGFNFLVVSTPRPHGVFAPTRYTYWLELVQ